MIDVSGMDAGQLEAVAVQAGGALDAAYQRYVRAYGKAPSICNDLHGIVAPPPAAVRLGEGCNIWESLCNARLMGIPDEDTDACYHIDHEWALRGYISAALEAQRIYTEAAVMVSVDARWYGEGWYAPFGRIGETDEDLRGYIDSVMGTEAGVPECIVYARRPSDLQRLPRHIEGAGE